VILVTVGAQMPFDRLVSGVDAWAAARRRSDVFMQVGVGGARPKHAEWVEFLEPAEFASRLADCSALVAHAGMGSILSALEAGKPIVVMPRRGEFRETRNDHQVATAIRFRSLGKVQVAMDETELPAALDGLDGLSAAERIAAEASPELVAAVSDFIHARGEFAVRR
jgi:UDP-N-acetylglucosamine transferase subunit ALG13